MPTLLRCQHTVNMCTVAVGVFLTVEHPGLIVLINFGKKEVSLAVEQCDSVCISISYYSVSMTRFISALPKRLPDAFLKVLHSFLCGHKKRDSAHYCQTTVNSFSSVCAISYRASVWEKAKDNIVCEWGLSVLYEARKGSSRHWLKSISFLCAFEIFFTYYCKWKQELSEPENREVFFSGPLKEIRALGGVCVWVWVWLHCNV